MALRWFLALALSSSLFLPVTEATAQTLDQYGGYTSLPVPGGATGNFRVGKLGDRWVFATPEGNAFWMTGVFHTDVDGRFVDLAAKYGGTNPRATWGIQATKRLKSWGFNSVAEYSSLYVLPSQAGVVKMPGMILARPTPAGFKNVGTRVPAGSTYKDLIDALAPGYAYASRTFPDVFDPAFASYVNVYMPAIAADPYWGGGLATSPWCIGLTVDDIDDVFGFGPGPELPAARLHPHPSWYAVAASPTKSSSTKHAQTYNDTKVYTKYTLQAFLKGRYATIGALNTAWGSNYTAWDSAGGWGVGTGWLDEDGRHTAWLGPRVGTLVGATPGVTKDLDDFLYEIAHQYFSIVTAAGREIAPDQLMWGPASLNGWGGLTRKPILQAAAVSFDVLNAQIGSQAVVDKTVAYLGDKPVVSWEGYAANSDSGMYAYPDLPPADSLTYQYTFPDQAARATNYAARMALLLTAKTVVGLKFWSWQDKWGEKLNWGLTTLKGNAYDGVEARIAVGTDPWGYATGGEDRDYGDFLTGVVTANATVAAVIGSSANGTPSTTSTTTVSISSPTTGSTLQQTVTVSATASTSTTRIDLALDGALVGIFGGNVAQFPWDTTASSNGTHRWIAKAYGSSGASVISSPVDVTVSNAITSDTTAPVVSITQSPNGSSVVRKTEYTIRATASDNVGVTRVEFYVSGSLKCSVTVAPYACQWQVPAANGKVYSLQAKAYDAQGNVGFSNIVTVQSQ